METTAKYKPNVEIASDPESLAQRSVELFVEDAQKAIKAKATPKQIKFLRGELKELIDKRSNL